jgi:hypothetical protein
MELEDRNDKRKKNKNLDGPATLLSAQMDNPARGSPA